MKKLLGVFLLLLGTFGIIQADPYSHLDVSDAPEQTWLAYRLLTADSIRYCAVVSPRAQSLVSEQEAEILLQAALREWTHGIALQIRQSGREKEFQDVLDILDKPFTLSHMPGCSSALRQQQRPGPQDTSADIAVLFSSQQCQKMFRKRTSFYLSGSPEHIPFICIQETQGENPLRPISDTEYIPQANTPQGRQILHARQTLFTQIAQGDYAAKEQQALWDTDRFFSYDTPTLFATIVHELGHAFGLGDEYRPDTRPNEYSSQQAGQGIMQRLYNRISCDEIDGIITLLDRLNQQERTFRSFCPNRSIIVNGTERPF